MSDPTARAEYRALLLSVLGMIPGIALQSPGDWNQPSIKLPVLKVRQGKDRKESNGTNGQTSFTTTSVFLLRVEVSAASGPAALLALEGFAADIEAAIFKSAPLRAKTQNFRFVETNTDVNAEGATHIGTMDIALGVEMFETFYPDVNAALAEIDLTADLVNVADPNGTYPNPPFPDAVTPAPRTAGPDGRAEGFVKVNFSQ
jgi:hypothetical protein